LNCRLNCGTSAYPNRSAILIHREVTAGHQVGRRVHPLAYQPDPRRHAKADAELPAEIVRAQVQLLREHGYACDHGVVYYAGSRTRVSVPFTDELETRTRQLIDQTREAAGRTAIPDPLDDSPKCHGCSLNGICLPDETLALRQLTVSIDAFKKSPHEQHHTTAERQGPVPGVRRFYPPRDHQQPLYVQDQGARVGKSHSRLVVRKDGNELTSVRLKDVSQLVLCGNIGVSAQTIHLLCEAAVPVVHLSMGHWFYGVTHGITLRNAYDRAAQFAAAADPHKCLELARQLVADKIINQRTMLRRNAAGSRELDAALRDLDDLAGRVAKIASIESLLGVEGAAAAHYFGRFDDMLKPRDFDATWDFTKRNRRPPRDPVNAMLSFAYALLAKECTVALLAEGLDPYWGFYHQPRHGRPALALDLMEPLRPTVADSAVLTAVNTGMVSRRSFTTNANACSLQPAGRKAMLRAYEARLDQLVTHPAFDYRCSWRTVIRLQARLLARHLRGDIATYTHVTPR
jgi:CRISPR-associated protein Cas1